MLKNKIYKYYFIYSITNNINLKEYVGFHATNDLNDGYMGSGIAINRAYKKYGKGNFGKRILEFCDKNNWSDREKYWINELNTYNKGYNLSKGGEGSAGIKLSDKAKQKISKSRKGKKISTQSKIKIGLKLSGRKTWNAGVKGWASKETSKMISKAHIGKPKSEEHRKNISEKLKINNPSKNLKTLEKISKSMKGKFTNNFNPIYGSSRTKDILQKLKDEGIKLKGDRWEYMRKKIKCTDLITNKIFIFDGVKDLSEKLNISKNKYYRSLKNPGLLMNYKFEDII